MTKSPPELFLNTPDGKNAGSRSKEKSSFGTSQIARLTRVHLGELLSNEDSEIVDVKEEDISISTQAILNARGEVVAQLHTLRPDAENYFEGSGTAYHPYGHPAYRQSKSKNARRRGTKRPEGFTAVEVQDEEELSADEEYADAGRVSLWGDVTKGQTEQVGTTVATVGEFEPGDRVRLWIPTQEKYPKRVQGKILGVNAIGSITVEYLENGKRKRALVPEQESSRLSKFADVAVEEDEPLDWQNEEPGEREETHYLVTVPSGKGQEIAGYILDDAEAAVTATKEDGTVIGHYPTVEVAMEKLLTANGIELPELEKPIVTVGDEILLSSADAKSNVKATVQKIDEENGMVRLAYKADGKTQIAYVDIEDIAKEGKSLVVKIPVETQVSEVGKPKAKEMQTGPVPAGEEDTEKKLREMEAELTPGTPIRVNEEGTSKPPFTARVTSIDEFHLIHLAPVGGGEEILAHASKITKGAEGYAFVKRKIRQERPQRPERPAKSAQQPEPIAESPLREGEEVVRKKTRGRRGGKKGRGQREARAQARIAIQNERASARAERSEQTE